MDRCVDVVVLDLGKLVVHGLLYLFCSVVVDVILVVVLKHDGGRIVVDSGYSAVFVAR